MITGWPIWSASLLPSSRASTSTAPPAAKGTTSRIGRLGYVWAWADDTASPSTSPNAALNGRKIRHERARANAVAPAPDVLLMAPLLRPPRWDRDRAHRRSRSRGAGPQRD